VLRDGRSVAGGEISRATDDSTFIPRIIEAMAGRSIAETYPRLPHEQGEAVLELEDLCGARLPNRARLTLHRGEILGIAGLVGAGRTELLRALFGLDPVRSGRVRIGTAWDHGRPPWDRLQQGVGLLAEDRKEEGLALGLSIGDNMTLSHPIATFGVISRMAHDQATRQLAAQLHVRYRDPRQAVAELSGGNQQKVAIARLLHHDTDIMLFDEPTRGVDVGSKTEIYRLIGELAQRGKSILFVSSYLPELLGICDRIAVMTRGTLSDARPAASWTERSLLEAATADTRG
jgi:ribose transport system ATP-binding protein